MKSPISRRLDATGNHTRNKPVGQEKAESRSLKDREPERCKSVDEVPRTKSFCRQAVPWYLASGAWMTSAASDRLDMASCFRTSR